MRLITGVDVSALCMRASRMKRCKLSVPPLQLSISEKGFKKMVELHKHYKEQLLDPDVQASFQVCSGGPSFVASPVQQAGCLNPT